MSATIVCRVLRPLMHAGRRLEAGQTLKVEPLQAAELLASGRAVLVHDGDGDEVRRARQDSVKRAVALAGRPWHGPQVSEPWQRIGE